MYVYVSVHACVCTCMQYMCQCNICVNVRMYGCRHINCIICVLLCSSVNGSARVSLLQLPLSSTQYCTILASLIRTASNTILLELHSQCLLINHTSTAILVKEKDRTGNGMVQRSLEDTETMIPSSDEVNGKSHLCSYSLFVFFSLCLV